MPARLASFSSLAAWPRLRSTADRKVPVRAVYSRPSSASVELAGRLERGQLGRPQDLVRISVAHPGQDGLVG